MGWARKNLGGDVVESIINPVGALKTGFESITGQREGERAAERGATAMERATTMGIEEQRAAREQIAQQLAPYMGAGGAAQSQLLSLLGITPPEQASAYQEAMAFQPRFSDKERAMIIQAGPSQRGRSSEQMQKLVGGMTTRGTAGTRAGTGAATERVSPELFRYQQALAEQDRIARNQQTIQQYQATTQSPQFGMLARDVTQGLPQAQLGEVGPLPGLPVGLPGNLPGMQAQFQGLPGVAMSSQAGLPGVLPGDIGQDSLFQSLKRQAISGIESSAAARGKLFSGTTPQAIAESVQNIALQRAGDIQRQNLAARQQLMGEQGQMFGETFGVRQQTAAEQQQEFQRAAAIRQQLLGEQAQLFGQSAAARGQLIGERGQLFGQELAARQALLGERVGEQERRYQQLFGLVGTGQASAAQQAANLQNAAANIGELYAQQANARAAGLMAQANLQAQAGQSFMNMFGRIGGAAAGNPSAFGG